MVQIVSIFILCDYLFIHVALFHLMQDGKYGETALMAASSQGHIECATVLLKHRADVNYRNKVRWLYECRVNMVQCYNINVLRTLVSHIQLGEYALMFCY